MANRVVTIGRQCGSGGHTIGKLVAQRLGVDFYDKKIVELTAAKTKLSPDFIRSHGEYFHGGAIGHIIGYGTRFGSGALKTGSALADQLQQAQSEILLEAAAKGPCVIVGRCADCVLAGKADTLNVFIHSEMSFKIERSIAEHGLEREKAASILARRDKAGPNTTASTRTSGGGTPATTISAWTAAGWGWRAAWPSSRRPTAAWGEKFRLFSCFFAPLRAYWRKDKEAQP